VNEVDKQLVLRRALAALRRPEHRSQLQRPRQRRLTAVDQGHGNAESAPISASVADRSSGRNSVHDAKLHWGKRSRRIRYVICLFRILSKQSCAGHLPGMRDLIIFPREAETAFRNDS